MKESLPSAASRQKIRLKALRCHPLSRTQQNRASP
ncbi:hypothetical protein CLOLEP_03609 [[Clostridium] leptum DSM 753]|uniref:Uncharacterized protein n=1 Tax=[Clostridium] leptum DSM 753 TaxID=428125 RepID=A7VYD1_9FIRM|nr:hypothetical protein CLOLEP_03609 [[Clostridium] leptum DSM 753]